MPLAWTAEHDMALYLANRCFGNAWQLFSALFPGWNVPFLKKKLAVDREPLRGSSSLMYVCMYACV